MACLGHKGLRNCLKEGNNKDDQSILKQKFGDERRLDFPEEIE